MALCLSRAEFLCCVSRWSRMTAKAIRASLLASATATSLKGLVSISLDAQVRKPSAWPLRLY